jgi:hypothetical protein
MRAGHKEMMAKLDTHHERMTACLGKTEATDLEANLGEIQSEAVQVTKEEAAVKSSGALKKWHSGRHLAAQCCQEAKERTRGNCGSRRKVAAAGRRVTRYAGVARRKGNVVGKNRTRDNVVRGVPNGWTL